MNLEQPIFPKLDLSSSIDTANILNDRLSDMVEAKERRYIDGVERENRMIELLESIDKNTSILPDMLKVLEENTQDQKAILEIINDFNMLATIETKDEKQSFYRKIMNKINTTISDVNTINTLIVYGMSIYNTLHTMGKI